MATHIVPRCARKALATLALALTACGAPVESTPTPPADDAPAFECGPSGYELEGALPGDVYRACGPERIQSVVVSGGTVAAPFWDGACLTIAVETTEPRAAPLTVDLRGAGGRSICADSFTRVDGAQ